MVIRSATRADCPAMLELIRELASYEKAPNEVTVDPMHFEESGFGEQPVWWAFVAEVDATPHADLNADPGSILLGAPGNVGYPSAVPGKRVVGFALYYIRYSTWKGQVMYLEDILVTEKMRGRGIGKLLMDQLIQEARNRGFGRMAWQVLEWNEPAIRFYQKYKAHFDAEWVNVVMEIE